jgi:MerR family redox-sensitive transcriptional activator SoxR
MFENATVSLLVQVNLRSRGARVMTIGQVASKTGLRASAIRYYEEQGLLPRASRKGGKRIYEASILERLAVIELAKMAGFELREIRAGLSTNEEPPLVWRTLGQAKRAELDRQIATLSRMKDVLARLSSCTCSTPDECRRAFTAARSLTPPESGKRSVMPSSRR